MPPFRPPASTPWSSVLTKSAMPCGRFSTKANSAPSTLELRVIQTTRRSALGCGIAGDHRLHRCRSLFLSPTGRDLCDPQPSENWHLHKIQDDGEGDGGNKGAGDHPCRQGRHRKASDC